MRKGRIRKKMMGLKRKHEEDKDVEEKRKEVERRGKEIERRYTRRGLKRWRNVLSIIILGNDPNHSIFFQNCFCCSKYRYYHTDNISDHNLPS